MLYWHVQYADHQRRVISHEVDSLTGSPYVGAPHSPHPDPQPHSFHRTPLPPQHCVSLRHTRPHSLLHLCAGAFKCGCQRRLDKWIPSWSDFTRAKHYIVSGVIGFTSSAMERMANTTRFRPAPTATPSNWNFTSREACGDREICQNGTKLCLKDLQHKNTHCSRDFFVIGLKLHFSPNDKNSNANATV